MQAKRIDQAISGLRNGRGTVAVVLLMTLLSGCLSGLGQPSASDLDKSPIFGGDKTTPSARLRRQVDVMQARLSVTAPKGYCVDEVSLVDRSNGAFVAFGACAALTGNGRDPKPATPAFLTVSVLPVPASTVAPGAGRADRLQQARRFLQSPAGRAALSRSADAQQVSLLELNAGADVLFARIQDRSAGLPKALFDTAWRAFFELNGALVVASVTPFKKQPVAKARGDALLRSFVGAIRKANPNKTTAGGVKNLLDRLRPGKISE